MAGPTRQCPGMVAPGTGHNRRTTSAGPDLTGTVGADPALGWVAEDATNAEVAAATVAGGWPVFPCLPTKAPATARGFKDATTDPGRVHAWWERHPDHLVGVPTDGLVVLDLDVDPDRDTWQWWQAVADDHGWSITENLVVATPSGGVHVYFAAPRGVEVRCSAGKVAPHVDVRAAGGYILAPGTTLSDGRRYEVLHLPDQLPEVPGWLVDMIAGPRPAPAATIRPAKRTARRREGTRYGVAALDAEVGRVATAPVGRRNDTLVRAAFRVGQLAAAGELDPIYAAEQLELAAVRAGLGQAEAEATIRSGMSAGGRHPRRPAA